MTPCKETYLQTLERNLNDHPDKHNILIEYGQHIEMLMSEGEETVSSEQEQWEYLVQRLGEPEYIALLFNREMAISPSRTTWMFIITNLMIFASGLLLSFCYNYFDLNAVKVLWNNLISLKFLIIIVYFFFWILLGYEIGKEFGQKGKALLVKTFLLSLIPNLTLMCLIVLRVIPHSWFQPLLSSQFIMICIICTAFLYPISFLGYYWGKKVSV